MLTIFIPAYNEQDIIRENALAAAAHAAAVGCKLGVEISVVVLDDGSTDGTKEEVQRAVAECDNLAYQWAPGPSRRENLVAAMLAAPTSHVGWMDADLATPLDYLEALVEASRHYDIVSGGRYLASSQARRSLYRSGISHGYNLLVRTLFHSRVRDHWCGFKIFRRSALQRISDYIGVGLLDRQMFWDAQMWMCAQRLKMDILEMPVAWTEGERSALSIKTEWPMVRYTLRYWATGTWRHIVPDDELHLEHS